MDDPRFEPIYIKNQRKRKNKKKKESLLTNGLALLFILCLISVLVFIFHSLSAQQLKTSQTKPPTGKKEEFGVAFLTATHTPTFTATLTVPTSTMTFTQTPTNTVTSTSTLTPTITLTPTPRLRPNTVTPQNLVAQPADVLTMAETTVVAALFAGRTPGAPTEMWFEMAGNPGALNANVIYSNADCSWMGVAGIITDLRGDPVVGLYVQIGGFEDGRIEETLSGLYPNYGESGYEITIARPVQVFEHPIWIQLLDENHVPVSEKKYFKPSDDCDKSLILINFHKVR